MAEVRPCAVAGLFYPRDPLELRRTVAALLAGPPAEGPAPKAVIAPHAGYVYSGGVAAAAYRRLAAARDRLRRVVLIGPAHRVPVAGIAASGATAFATPLGEVRVDAEGVARALAQPAVEVNDLAHRDEHCLEVQLPFLRALFEDIAIVPLVAGWPPTGAVARVIEALWGGPETAIVVSSDLSHYLTYQQARALDAQTCAAILKLDGAALAHEQACGQAAIEGLLAVARAHRLGVETLALCNSGDTAGSRDRVVGYGAWSLTEAATKARTEPAGEAEQAAPASEPAPGVVERHGQLLLRLAERSIAYGLEAGRPLAVRVQTYAPELRAPRASFVTLKRQGRLRGCIGSVRAHRPLVADVAVNAFAAAFRDPRFKPLAAGEGAELAISVSLLGPPSPIAAGSEAELLRALRPGVDGLLLEWRNRRSVFLPVVWSIFPEPRDFLAQLKHKAGLPANAWSPGFTFHRFATEEIAGA